MKKVLITGIDGQDGSNLVKVLGEKGYKIYGLVRRKSNRQIDPRKLEIRDKYNVEIVTGDLTDEVSLMKAIERSGPDEIYNMAAQSHVGVSWSIPIQTLDVTGLGAIRLFEAARRVNPAIRIYQASSSELYGLAKEVPQNENTPFYPRSPYAVGKLTAHTYAINMRESYDMYISSGILFNHEGKLRSPEFVTRKITLSVARIKLGLQDKLELGNLDAKRDWGDSEDYMEACYLMLQQDKPEDFVIATGETHTVREFVELAFAHVGLNPEKHIKINSKYIRPAEVPLLLGDATKAKEKLGWEPKVKFKELVANMVEADLDYVMRYEIGLKK